MTTPCESPCCSSDARLSGLCEMHYWKREAERLSAEVDALKACAGVTRQPLSITRETVLNLTPRAATPPPTMAPPVDVAVEKEGKR